MGNRGAHARGDVLWRHRRCRVAPCARRGLDRGITFYDTASVYGDGHSEELIGECFDRRRHEIVIATKAGITSSFRGYDFSAPALRASLEGSLRRLRTDYVDLFQLHNAGPDVVLDQPHIVRTVAAVRGGGKDQGLGFSTPTPEDALALLGCPGRRVLPGELQSAGLARRSRWVCSTAPDRATSALSRALRWPLAFSPDGSTRTRSSPATITAADGHARADCRVGRGRRLRRRGIDIPDSPPSRVAVALRFCLSFEAVATVIPGMLSPAEVVANVVACERGRSISKRHPVRRESLSPL